jgi:hypothetical protein
MSNENLGCEILEESTKTKPAGAVAAAAALSP